MFKVQANVTLDIFIHVILIYVYLCIRICMIKRVNLSNIYLNCTFRIYWSCLFLNQRLCYTILAQWRQIVVLSLTCRLSKGVLPRYYPWIIACLPPLAWSDISSCNTQVLNLFDQWVCTTTLILFANESCLGSIRLLYVETFAKASRAILFLRRRRSVYHFSFIWSCPCILRSLCSECQVIVALNFSGRLDKLLMIEEWRRSWYWRKLLKVVSCKCRMKSWWVLMIHRTSWLCKVTIHLI